MDRAMPFAIKAAVSEPIRNGFYFFCDMLLLCVVMSLQGASLNLYIMKEFKENYLPHFLFLGDFICVILSLGSMRFTYSYLRKTKEQEEANSADKNTFIYSPKKLIKKFPTSKLGILPLSYVSWLVYISFLLLKIIIIYCSGLCIQLKTTDFFGPQTLQLTVGFTSIVFMLFVEAHNWDFVSLKRRTFVMTVCVRTGFEIFDSVDMLSLITDQQRQENLQQGSIADSIRIPYEDLIFVLVSLNFILPVLSLYKLSLPDNPNQSNFTVMLPVHVLYHVLHLFFVDLPFLTVRVYAWLTFHADISMFLMKNLLHIIISIRSIYPELKQLLQRDKTRPSSNNQPRNPNDFEDINLN